MACSGTEAEIFMDQVAQDLALKGGAKLPATLAQRKQNKTKKDRLIALLSKPNGPGVSVLCKALSWQKHTVRAALSGLRKQGLAIETARSVKGDEAVYTLTVQSKVEIHS
ncbi:hypothetical protein RC74_12105 [Falsihalocynthiibacter arcticus]|uniref:DUF3489 domain-containing protein n=2 Tax=Falsihalocynthiibacter arcticus TaxID=1579316 RepID=A0A126V2J2_9RHOB|nr:hypothetical protein RC74_12105 [Falsihalocynthiibacter arcticus]